MWASVQLFICDACLCVCVLCSQLFTSTCCTIPISLYLIYELMGTHTHAYTQNHAIRRISNIVVGITVNTTHCSGGKRFNRGKQARINIQTCGHDSISPHNSYLLLVSFLFQISNIIFSKWNFVDASMHRKKDCFFNFWPY